MPFHLLPTRREASLFCLRPEGRRRRSGLGSGVPRDPFSAAEPGLARPEGHVRFGSRLRTPPRRSLPLRGGAWCLDVLPFPSRRGWCSELGFRPPFPREGWLPPLPEAACAEAPKSPFALGLQRRIRPTWVSSLIAVASNRSLAVPSAEAGGSPWPSRLLPQHRGVGFTVTTEVGRARASQQAGTGAWGGRHRGAEAAGRSPWPPWLPDPKTLLPRPWFPVSVGNRGCLRRSG